MNPTITSAARLVILAVAGLAVLVILVVGALVAFFDTSPQDAVLVGALVVNGPVMGLLGLLANTRPNESMVAALARPKDPEVP